MRGLLSQISPSTCQATSEDQQRLFAASNPEQLVEREVRGALSCSVTKYCGR